MMAKIVIYSLLPIALADEWQFAENETQCTSAQKECPEYSECYEYGHDVIKRSACKDESNLCSCMPRCERFSAANCPLYCKVKGWYPFTKCVHRECEGSGPCKEGGICENNICVVATASRSSEQHYWEKMEGRCGPTFLVNEKAGTCLISALRVKAYADSLFGPFPCCSLWGWCGDEEVGHCNCDGCMDYRRIPEGQPCEESDQGTENIYNPEKKCIQGTQCVEKKCIQGTQAQEGMSIKSGLEIKETGGNSPAMIGIVIGTVVAVVVTGVTAYLLFIK